MYKADIYNTETGEVVKEGATLEELKGAVELKKKKEYIEKRKKVTHFIENNREDELTIEEMEFAIGKKNINIKLDFTDDGYFMVKENSNTLNLNIRTRGLLFSLGEFMSHDGRLVYKNGRAIKTYKAIKELMNISANDWNVYISKDINNFNLIKRDIVDGRRYFILNPLYMFKARKISETVFIAFHNELESYLSDLEYAYLCKKYGVRPE